MEITATEMNKENRIKRTEDSLRDHWDNIKCSNIHIIGVPKGEEREKGPKKIFEDIIAENFLNMGKETLTQVEEAQRIQCSINPRRKKDKIIPFAATRMELEILTLSEVKSERDIISFICGV